MVDEDNAQMSEFVRHKLGSFMNGKAFYEFTQKEEDLSYYKEVVNVQKSWVGREHHSYMQGIFGMICASEIIVFMVV